MREKQNFAGRISRPILVFVAILIVALIGFAAIEGWSLLNGYFGFVSATFGDWFAALPELSTRGKVFATFLNLIGVLGAGYFFAELTSLLVEGQLKNIIKFKKMDKEIATLDSHFIICGIGSTAKHIVEEFTKTDTPFVVVDNSTEKCEALLEDYPGLLYLDEDPTEDETLEKIGIKKAKGLIASLGNDHENLYTVITARNLNDNLKIISEVIEPNAKEKIIRAGADETVSPNHIGGLRIASVMIRPTVVGFLDTLLRGTGTVRFEEITLSKGSKLLGKQFKDSQEAEETGLSIVAIKKQGAEDYVCNPTADVTMEAGDALVTLGEAQQKEAFEKKYN